MHPFNVSVSVGILTILIAGRYFRSPRTALLPRPGAVSCTVLVLAFVCFCGCRTAIPKRIPQPPSLDNDRRLIIESLAHTELDIEILDTCTGNAVRAELKSYCQEEVAQQRREIDGFRSWLSNWYGLNGNDLSEMNQIKEERRQLLRSLERKGDLPYEFRLLLNIVSHASEAMSDRRACGVEAYRMELKEFCQATSELRRTRGRIPEKWVCEWYRDCISKAFPPYGK